jgi:hypothetical protein
MPTIALSGLDACTPHTQDFGGLPRSSSQAFSGRASPHSGMATPTAAGAAAGGAPAGLFSPGPGGFFGGGSLAMRTGSFQHMGESFSLGMRSGETAGYAAGGGVGYIAHAGGRAKWLICRVIWMLHMQRGGDLGVCMRTAIPLLPGCCNSPGIPCLPACLPAEQCRTRHVSSVGARLGLHMMALLVD